MKALPAMSSVKMMVPVTTFGRIGRIVGDLCANLAFAPSARLSVCGDPPPRSASGASHIHTAHHSH